MSVNEAAAAANPPKIGEESMLISSNDVLLQCVNELNRLETLQLKRETLDESAIKVDDLDKIVDAVNRNINLRRPLLDLISAKSRSFSDLTIRMEGDAARSKRKNKGKVSGGHSKRNVKRY